MKKKLFSFALIVIVFNLPLSAVASPQQDLKEWRNFFMQKFPSVKFDEYANGLYALPGAEDRRAEWESIMEFPPYELELEAGKKFWDENKMSSCFRNRGKGTAQYYPYWNGNEVRTLELDINDCLKKKGLEAFDDLEKGMLAQVTAYIKSLSRGKRMKVKLSSVEAVQAYENGRTHYWARRGQLNFSCAHCHIDNAGKFLGGNILSAGLGHGVGFPAYRSKWGGLGTLHRRYRGCNRQIGAMPLPAQSNIYRELELYEAYMNTGLPLTAPSQRF